MKREELGPRQGRYASGDIFDAIDRRLSHCGTISPSGAHCMVGPRSLRHLIAARQVSRDLKKFANESAGLAD